MDAVEVPVDAERNPAVSVSESQPHRPAPPPPIQDMKSRSDAPPRPAGPPPTQSLPAPAGGKVEGKDRNIERIEVEDPRTIGATLQRKYTTYAVVVFPPIPGISHVRRRYSDFQWLRDHLMAEFPGIFVPPCPPKKALGRFNAEFVSERAKALARFLNRINQVAHLANSTAFQMFLTRHENALEDVREECAHALKQRDDMEVVRAYTQLFPAAIASKLPADVEEAINNLRRYLNSSKDTLSDMVSKLETMDERRKKDIMDSTIVSNAFGELVRIENGFAQRPQPPRVDVTSHFVGWVEAHKAQEATLSENIFLTFRNELEDIEAFLEVLSHRDDMVARCAKLKSRVDKWRSKQDAGKLSGEKDSQTMQEDQLNHAQSVKMLELVTKCILLNQVKSHWVGKVSTFRAAMAQYARSQIEIANEVSAIWEGIAKPSAE